jgi:SET domain-containing protein
MEEAEEDVFISPEHVLTFERDKFQSTATITIKRSPHYKKPIHYQLKTTHKQAYVVSSAKGEITAEEKDRDIHIEIDEGYPLEQCLLDRFKLIVCTQDREPI